jgi:hypothetical protein
MPRAFVPGFDARRHGFPFGNAFPDGTPVFALGPVRFGNAAVGLCGGMVYTATDLFLYGRPVPNEPTEPVVRYFCRRLLDSFAFPIGWTKYWYWQSRQSLADRTVRDWPRLRQILDDGMPCPLGLVKIHSRDPREMGRNHQVLAYGYDLDGDRDLTLHAYDPNWPGDGIALRTRLGSESVDHSIEGESIRGFFPTVYARPAEAPVFDGPSF